MKASVFILYFETPSKDICNNHFGVIVLAKCVLFVVLRFKLYAELLQRPGRTAVPLLAD